MILAKHIDGEPLDVRFVSEIQGSYVTELRETGFLDFVASEQPQCDTGFVAVDSYVVKDGKLVQSWEIKTDPEAVKTQIAELKEKLSSTDYMVIKCYECQLVGDALPYDIGALHREKQAIRDKINRLEAEI